MVDIVNVSDAFPQLQKIGNDGIEIVGIQRAFFQRSLETQLDVEFQAADSGKIILARIEEHPLKQMGCRFQGGRVPGAELAVDLDQGLLGRLDAVLLDRLAEHHPHIVSLRLENGKPGDAGIDDFRDIGHLQFFIGFNKHFPGLGIHHVSRGKVSLQIVGADLYLVDPGFGDVIVLAVGDSLAGMAQHVTGFGMNHVMRNLHADQAFRNIPLQPPLGHADGIGLIESTDQLLVILQTECPQEDGPQELPFSVNPNVKEVFLIVFEFHPGTPIGNDLSQEVGLGAGRLEKHAGRSMQLADNDTLGAIDHEGSILGHQRNLTEVDFLLLDVPDGFASRIGILVVNRQPDSHLQRRGIGHSPFLALGYVVLQLEADGIAAVVAKPGRIPVVGSAFGTDDVVDRERVGHDVRPAGLALDSQVLQSLELTALAFPVADRVVHKLQRGDPSKVADGKHGIEHGLQTGILTFIGQQAHLKKSFV